MTTADQINELRAELNDCIFSKSVRRQVEAELRRLVEEHEREIKQRWGAIDRPFELLKCKSAWKIDPLIGGIGVQS